MKMKEDRLKLRLTGQKLSSTHFQDVPKNMNR